MPVNISTIDDVLAELDRIIAETVAEGNRMAIFAYVYRRTTAEIKKAIRENRFHNNARMEAFDVSFAQLYLQAYADYRAGKPITGAWRTAFKAAEEPLAALQHIMLGMNSHINLDLGIAAGRFAPGVAIYNLQADFMLVNEILKSLINEMQDGLSRVSPMMFLLDWSGESKDEIVMGFSIVKARDFAWTLALSLSQLDAAAQAREIESVDTVITRLAETFWRPPGRLLKYLLGIVAYFEPKEVSKIIYRLKQDERA